MRLRKFAAVSTLALAAAGLTAVTAPAQAASANNDYTCAGTLNGGMALSGIKVKGWIDTNLAATSVAGTSGLGTITVTVDEETTGLLAALGGKTVDGSVTVNTTANGAKVPFSGAAKNVPVPASGPLKATVRGSMGALTRLGATTIDAKSFSLRMLVKKTDGETLDVKLNCTANAGAVTKVDATNVVAATTVTTIKAAKPAKGKATLTVKVAGLKSGTVKVQVKGKKKVTKTVKIVNGTGKVVVKKLKKGKYRAQAKFAGTAVAKASSSKTISFKVK